MNTRKLQLSLFHLNIIVQDMSNIINAFNETEPLPPALFIPIYKYMIVRTCAFYDEVTRQFLKLAKCNEDRFKKIESIISYIITERDKYFPDLYNIRNNILAHNYRVKVNNDLISIFEKQIHFTFPKYAVEHVINIHLMDALLSAIKRIYPEIYQIMDDNVFAPSENMSLTLINEINYNSIINKIDADIQRIADGNL